MSDYLTQIELCIVPKRFGYYLRFGQLVRRRYISSQRSIACIAPGSVFSYGRWAIDRRGDRAERFWILQAGDVNADIAAIPGIVPGAQVLLDTQNAPSIHRISAVIDRIEASVNDAAEVCPDYWQHAHNRLAAGLSPHAYTAEQHRAWLLRQVFRR